MSTVPIDSIKPNTYNPNKQDDEVFALLKKSIEEDGFTQPVIVQKKTSEIVDGEHRWRACKELEHKTIPVVFVNMTPEQMRIATLRHNRTRGQEDFDSVVSLFNELESMDALNWASESLMMSGDEINALIDKTPDVDVSIEEEKPEKKKGKSITCPNCEHEFCPTS